MTKLGWTLVGLVVVGGVALVARSSSGAERPALEGGGSLPLPSGGGRRRARVRSSVNVRTAPSASAPLVAVNDAFVGSEIEVLETGIASAQPNVSREWWRVVTPGGSEGFASAVGPRGEKNLEIV